MEVKSGCLLQPVRPPCSLFTLQSSSGVWVWRCSTVITQPILLSAAPYERSFETPVLLRTVQMCNCSESVAQVSLANPFSPCSTN